MQQASAPPLPFRSPEPFTLLDQLQLAVPRPELFLAASARQSRVAVSPEASLDTAGPSSSQWGWNLRPSFAQACPC